MARRYGSSYSSESRCFSYYWNRRPYAIANYAHTVVFLAVYLGILVTLCVVRKRAGAGKRLIGLAYIGSLFFMVISYIYQLILSTLSACEALNDVEAVYDSTIASLVFSWIQTMLFLYVVFYLLNMMLRKQLGQTFSVLRIVFGMALFILGVLLLTETAILGQFNYWMGRGQYPPSGIRGVTILYLDVAFGALRVLCVLVSGILSILAAKPLRQKNMAQNSLLIWVAVLHFSLLVSTVWYLTAAAGQLSRGFYYGGLSFTVMSWISSVFFALAYVSIIVIAKNPVWRPTAGAFTTGPSQQQYAYYQEAPVSHGAQRA